MRALTFHDALSEALTDEMRRDARVLLLGPGVATKRPELQAEFGRHRVRNTPLAETIVAGTAIGAAANGLRPIVDLSFAPPLSHAMSMLIHGAGRLRYVSGGQFQCPLVVLAAAGAGSMAGAEHDHNLEAMFVHTPGLKVVAPSNPIDCKGLLKAAIRDDNPVLFFADLVFGDRGLGPATGAAEHADGIPPLGKAAIARRGADVTLVSYGATVAHCLAAADQLAANGVSAEVIDLRTLKPLDEGAVLRSVHKTGRLIVVHEASRSCGIGAEIAAIVSEKAFDALNAPVIRLTGPDAPAAASRALARAATPQPSAIREAALRLLEQAAAA